MSFDNLWAGWRHEYVVAATEAGRAGDAASSDQAGGQQGGPAGVSGAPEPQRPGAPDGESETCVFCLLASAGAGTAGDGVVWRGNHVYAVLNRYPYASGHVLVLPLRHVGDLSALSAEESHELWEATQGALSAVIGAYDPDGVNLGANLGRAAGAGIPGHLHVHVVPRWAADTNFMTSIAGVRVIPEALEVAWEKITRAWPRSSPAPPAPPAPPDPPG